MKSNQSRIEKAREFLALQPADRPLLVLSPSRMVSEEVTRGLAGATFGWYRLSWDQFLERLIQPHCLGRQQPLSRLGRWALLQQTLQTTELQHYQALRSFPGFAICLERTLGESRLHGVELPNDLGRLGSAYEESLHAQGLLDRAEILRLAAQAITQDSWVGGFQAVLVLDLELESEGETAMLQQLLQRVPNHCIISVPGEFSWETLEPTKLRVVSAPDEALECQEVARELLWGAEQGWCWDEMAVLLRQPERYSWCLQSALERAEIPAYFSEGSKAPHPLGRAFLSLLQCAREGLSARRFAEYLSLGQAPPEAFPQTDTEEGRHIPTPYRWEELLGAASVIQGPQRWHRRLSGLAHQRRQQIEQLLREDADSPRIAHFQREIEELESLETFALPLVERMAGWSNRRTWVEWLEELGYVARKGLAQAEPILEKLRELEPLGQIRASLDDVLATLTPELSQIRLPARGHRYGQVFVGSLEEAAGRSFKQVIVPGMAERRFSPLLREDPLLNDDQRKALSPALSTRESRDALERARMTAVLGAAQSRLVLSYPRQDQEHGRPLLPSVFLLEIVRSARGALPAFQALIVEAAQNGSLSSSWPAPEDPQRAIDWHEHSLAWLRRLRPQGVRGSAHFLLSRNPFLAQALRARMRREKRVWTQADGCVGMPLREQEWLLPRRRPYSPSTLERFAKCPYQFWLHSIYHLSPREVPEPLEEMDPLTRGNFIHEVHSRLVWRITAALPSAVPLPTRLEWLMEESAAVSEQFLDEYCPLVPRVFQDEIAQLEQELAEWLKLHHDPQWSPLHAELAFQLGGETRRDPASSPSPAPLGEGFSMRGSIDLVERSEAGKLRVIDLKTGMVKAKENFLMGGGETLQPALYAMAVEDFLGAQVVQASLEYCTLRGSFSSVVLQRVPQARRKILEALGQLQGSMEAGHLPAYPQRDGCSRCDYQAVCGPRAEMLSRHKPFGTRATAAADWWREQP